MAAAHCHGQAFLSEPEVLLLDEPTNHLDIDSQSFVEQLEELPRGHYSHSHDLALLDMLTTRTIAFAHDELKNMRVTIRFIKESALRREILLKQKNPRA